MAPTLKPSTPEISYRAGVCTHVHSGLHLCVQAAVLGRPLAIPSPTVNHRTAKQPNALGVDLPGCKLAGMGQAIFARMR